MGPNKIENIRVKSDSLETPTPTYLPPSRPLTFRTFVEEMEEILRVEGDGGAFGYLA